MYALYDKKAEMYDTPVFLLSDVHAKRWFYTMVQKKEGRFEYFADEIELHKITKFNVTTGKLFEEKVQIILEGKQKEKLHLQKQSLPKNLKRSLLLF